MAKKRKMLENVVSEATDESGIRTSIVVSYPEPYEPPKLPPFNDTKWLKRGMTIAVCVNPCNRADSAWVMVIDTGKLDPSKESDNQWLYAIEQELNRARKGRGVIGDEVYPDDWDCLSGACVENFPTQVHGEATVFYGAE